MRFRPSIFAKDYANLVVKQGLGNIDAGEPYRPLISAHNFSSSGVRSIKPSASPDQSCQHVLSRGESDAYLLFRYQPRVRKIYTQVALDPAVTSRIAARFRLRHPNVRGDDTIMSTDFVLETDSARSPLRRAISIKMRSLVTGRDMDKAHIERLYWAERDVKWTLLLVEQMPQVRLHNLRRIHPRLHADSLNCGPQELAIVTSWLIPIISHQRLPLGLVCRRCDQRMGLQPGTALSVVYHLLATRVIEADLNIPIAGYKILQLKPREQDSE